MIKERKDEEENFENVVVKKIYKRKRNKDLT
jgi:hypothetical protein